MMQTSLNDLNKLVETKIGNNGDILQKHVEVIIEKILLLLRTQINNLVSAIEDSVNFYSQIENKLFSSLTEKGKESLKIILSAPNTYYCKWCS